MTNKERYRQAFSVLRTSAAFSLEVEEMEKRRKQYRRKTLVASVAACLMLMGSATAAYATDIGGIQRKIQLWVREDQTEATIRFDGAGGYSMEYTDEEGNHREQSGGGVAYSWLGGERPLTEEELLEEMNAPEVVYEEDGSVLVYWMGQKVDITDRFEDDICYVKLAGEEETLYMTVKYQNGYATSPHKYISPREFN